MTHDISFAELHALVGAWLPGQTYFVGVIAHHTSRGPDIVTWSITHNFTNDSCERIEAPTAHEALAQLRAAVPAPQTALANVGHVA